jgi:hypothetical protein
MKVTGTGRITSVSYTIGPGQARRAPHSWCCLSRPRYAHEEFVWVVKRLPARLRRVMKQNVTIAVEKTLLRKAQELTGIGSASANGPGEGRWRGSPNHSTSVAGSDFPGRRCMIVRTFIDSNVFICAHDAGAGSKQRRRQTSDFVCLFDRNIPSMRVSALSASSFRRPASTQFRLLNRG